jgi:hypothetical protein
MIDQLSDVMNPIDTIDITMKALVSELDKPELTNNSNFTILLVPSSGTISYLSDPFSPETPPVTVTVTCSEPFQGCVGFLPDTFDVSVPYFLVEIPSGRTLPSEDRISVQLSNWFQFRVEWKQKQLIIGQNICIAEMAGYEKHPFRIVVAGGGHMTCSLVTDHEAGDASSFITVSQIGFSQPLSSGQKLFTLPDWATGPRLERFLHDYHSIPQFIPMTISGSIPKWQLHIAPIILHFARAQTTSASLKKWVLKRYSTQLYSQWATVVLIDLLSLGSAEALSPPALARLFSLLLIALEPYEESSLTIGLFPFSLDTSILAGDAKRNRLNFDIHDRAYKAMRTLVRDPRMIEALQVRISQMNASAAVHLANDWTVHPASWPYPLMLDQGTSSVVSTPSFFAVMRLSKHSQGHTFPYIAETIPKIQIHIKEHPPCPVSVLMVAPMSYGNSIELLLLIKQYSLMNRDIVFVRTILIQHILTQSPFSWVFLPQFILTVASGVINSSRVDQDYLAHLAVLGSLINTLPEFVDPVFMTFFMQARQAITSTLPGLLSPFFPEFVPDSTGVSPADTFISIDLPLLDIPINIRDPLGEFLLYKSVITNQGSLRDFPVFGVLPIWLSLGRRVMIPPTVEALRDSNKVRVSNPSGRRCVVTIAGKCPLPPDFYCLQSTTPGFEEPSRVSLANPVTFEGTELWLSIVNLPDNPKKLAITAQSEYCENPVGTLWHQFKPSMIHDTFVRDVQSLVFDWTPNHTQALLPLFPPGMLKQRQFEPFVHAVLASPFRESFSMRVLLLCAFLVHRLNYLHNFYWAQVPAPFWQAVMIYISTDEVAQQFIQTLRYGPLKTFPMSINRRDASRLALDGQGDSRRSIIGQFAKVITRIPMGHLQNAECPWQVSFVGEGAIDAGGPRRELFFEISSSIFEPTSDIFVLSPNGRYHTGNFREVYVPHTSLRHRDAARIYYAVGVFLGIVIRCGFPQHIPFAPLVWKIIAQEKLLASDVALIDDRLRDLVTRVRHAKDDPDFVDRFNLRWEYEGWDGNIYELRRPSASRVVTGTQVDDWISAVFRARMEALTEWTASIVRGFTDNIGSAQRPFVNGALLAMLVQGSNVVTTEELKRIVSFVGFGTDRIGVQNFWAAVKRMTNEQRCMLLKFVTTLPRLPNPRTNPSFSIKITKMDNADDSRLPEASTCFNRMYLPVYSTPQVAFQRIVVAIESCATMENS